MNLKGLEDIVQMMMLGGKDPNRIALKVHLKRNPKLIGGIEYCPICHREVIKNDRGDRHCSNFKILNDISNYDWSGETKPCFWHKYENGLNYWTDDPGEIARATLTEDEKAKFPKHMREQFGF